MAFDYEEFKAKVSTFLTEANRKIRQYTPETFSKEKKFINAIVASMALMVMSDKKVETREVTASVDMINDIDQIKDLEMQTEAIELFEMHIERLVPASEKETKWILETAKLLGDIGKVRDYPEYIPMIRNLLDYIAQADGDFSADEVEMKNKIIDAIS